MFKAMMDENKEMRKTIQEMIPKIEIKTHIIQILIIILH